MSANVGIETVGAVTIPLSGTASNVVTSKYTTGDAECISIMAPATLDAGTYTLQVSDAVDGTFRTAQDETGTNIVIPGAGKSIVYSLPLWPFWRIAGPSAAAARIFTVHKMSRS